MTKNLLRFTKHAEMEVDSNLNLELSVKDENTVIVRFTDDMMMIERPIEFIDNGKSVLEKGFTIYGASYLFSEFNTAC